MGLPEREKGTLGRRKKTPYQESVEIDVTMGLEVTATHVTERGQVVLSLKY